MSRSTPQLRGTIASLSLYTLLAGSIVCTTSRSAEADRIRLRDTTFIRDKTVVRFNVDGVQLDDGTMLSWADIRTGSVAEAQQAEFDRLLDELGDRLFRLSTRLKVGDYKGLLDEAEFLYERYRARTSDTAYMVNQALMWALLATGQRERALEPYFRCYELLRSGQVKADRLPGQRRLKFDAPTGLTPELTPIWFDRDAARREMSSVRDAIRAMKRRPPGAFVYYGTMALAAEDEAQATVALNLVKPSSSPQLVELKTILAAQSEVEAGKPGRAVAALRAQIDRMSSVNRPLAWYWLGMAKLRAEPRSRVQSGILDLLRVPALFGEQVPELAAAALFAVMQSLTDQDDVRGSVAVRNELLIRYGQTYFAGQAKSPPAGGMP